MAGQQRCQNGHPAGTIKSASRLEDAAGVKRKLSSRLLQYIALSWPTFNLGPKYTISLCARRCRRHRARQPERPALWAIARTSNDDDVVVYLVRWLLRRKIPPAIVSLTWGVPTHPLRQFTGEVLFLMSGDHAPFPLEADAMIMVAILVLRAISGHQMLHTCVKRTMLLEP